LDLIFFCLAKSKKEVLSSPPIKIPRFLGGGFVFLIDKYTLLCYNNLKSNFFWSKDVRY